MNNTNLWDQWYLEQSGFGLDSRDQADPYYNSNNGSALPIIVAPMDTTISLENYKLFTDHNLIVCIPRMQDEEFYNLEKENNKKVFYSVSLSQFENIINEGIYPKYQILIDVANGNMPKLHKLITVAKHIFKENITIMAGNVGSKAAFEELQQAGADYIRVGIGSGSSCNTAVHTGIYQNLPMLIQECAIIASSAKIVADGGFRQYSDIIKALACGADYVMCGGIFNKCIESCGQKFYKGGDTASSIYEIDLNKTDISISTLIKFESLYVKYRGMSTQEVQKSWGKNDVRHSEGKSFLNKVEYSIEDWIHGSEIFPDKYPGFLNVLKSAMSYTGSQSIKDFTSNVKIKKI